MSRIASLLLGCLAVATTAARLTAQDTTSDSLTAKRRHYIPPVHRDAWKPAAALTVATVALLPADKWILRKIRTPAHVQSETWHRTLGVFDHLASSGGSQVLGPMFWVLGDVARLPGPVDVGMHMFEAYGAGTSVHYVVRSLIGRPRPNEPLDSVSASEFHLRFDYKRNIDKNSKSQEGSFPSGHALGTFAVATALHYELGAWTPRIALPARLVLWTVVAGDCVSRVYSDNHWATDVVGAAALGIFTGRTVVGLVHTHPHNVVDRTLRLITFAPAPDGAYRTGMSIRW